MNIEDFIEVTNKAHSLEELFGFYEKAMSDIGLDRVIFSLMTDHASLKKEAVHGIVRNYPEHWMDYYVNAGYEEIDPVRARVFCASTPFLWKELIEKGNLTQDQLKLMLEGEESGLYAGIGIPLRSNRGALAAVGAASTDRNLLLNENQISYANLVSYQFYTCFQTLMASQSEFPEIILSEKEKDVLKWSASGKTKSEIGDLMCLSKHTVDYHTRRILKKLHANNMTTAVVKALNLGLIQI